MPERSCVAEARSAGFRGDGRRSLGRRGGVARTTRPRPPGDACPGVCTCVSRSRSVVGVADGGVLSGASAPLLRVSSSSWFNCAFSSRVARRSRAMT